MLKFNKNVGYIVCVLYNIHNDIIRYLLLNNAVYCVFYCRLMMIQNGKLVTCYGQRFQDIRGGHVLLLPILSP